MVSPRTRGTLGAIGSALWWRDRNSHYDQCVHSRSEQCIERSTIDRQRMAALALTLSLSVAALACLPSGLVWNCSIEPLLEARA